MRALFDNILNVFLEASPYLLLGCLISGILSVWLPTEKIIKHIGGTSFSSVLKAALIGLPLPLCSCGVVPTALGLRKRGASRGATVSFLISTPETGVESVALTWALINPLMTIFRPVAALLTAMFAGVMVNITESEDHPALRDPDASCTTCHEEACAGRHAWTEKLAGAMHFGFVDLMNDIAKWLFLGLVLAGVINWCVPDQFFQQYLGSDVLSMFVMLMAGIPLYVCAAASTPIAAALMFKGLSPGAALVFLLVGPATNIATLLVVAQNLGKKAMVWYMASMITVSLLLGVLLNGISSQADSFWNGAATRIAHQHGMLPYGVKVLCVLLLLACMAYAMLRGVKPSEHNVPEGEPSCCGQGRQPKASDHACCSAHEST